jgi:hypothetical protein
MKCFLIVSLLAATHLSYSQSSYYETDYRVFCGGLALGSNITQVDGDNYKGYHNAGVNAGGVLFARLSEHTMAGIELLYVEKGSRGGAQRSVIPGIWLQHYKIKTEYAEIPVQFYYMDRKWNHFGAGFAYGRLVNTTEIVESKPAYDFRVEEYSFKKHELSFLIGGSLCLWKGLFANARFQYSLVEARGASPEGISWHGQYNNVWTFRLMYILGKDPKPGY